MRLLPAGGHRRMAWKNGGGETIEIAVHPPGADLSAFDWRVSMASVAADGPFSLFAGIDRTLCLLGGTGMVLHVEGLGRFDLTPASPPLAFPADAPARAELVDGPITDLNVMTRRGVRRHRVDRLGPGAALTAGPENGPVLVVALGPVGVFDGRDRATMAAGDAVVGEGRPLEIRVPHGSPGAYRVAILSA